MKKNKLILIIVIITFFITGCYSKEANELAKRYRKQGKINAINYVKAKYNFNATVKSVDEEINCDSIWGCLSSSPNGSVRVKLNANNKDFYVYVTGEYKSNEAIDDYQFKEIETDFIEFFRNNIALNLYDYKLEFNSRGIHEYYNNNLDDMISYISNIELYYIGENDLNQLNINSLEEKFKNHSESINLINFKTREKCNAYKKAEIENVSLSDDNMKNIYKSSMLTLSQGQKTFYNYDNITNYNDDAYVYSSQDNNKYEISLTNLDDLNYYKESYPELSDKKIVQVTNAYSIPSSDSFLYIYFPIEKVNAKKSDKIYLVSECNVNGNKKHFIESYYGIDSTIKIGIVGDYYIEQIRYSQCDIDSVINFALIKIND